MKKLFLILLAAINITCFGQGNFMLLQKESEPFTDSYNSNEYLIIEKTMNNSWKMEHYYFPNYFLNTDDGNQINFEYKKIYD
jgi:hypothetical protein